MKTILNFVFLLRSSFACLLIGFFSLSFANPHPTWGQKYFENIQLSYGGVIAQRAKRLEALILKNAGRPVEEKLAAVNHFFNEVEYVSDLAHWGRSDYWQTPLETLIEFKGDCEDIAIAKYAALSAMGVPEEKLAIVYTKMNGKPHILLVYFPSKSADPFVLDSIGNKVMKASARTGLVPIYGFNGTSLWLIDRQMRKFGKVMPVPASHKVVLNFA